MFSSVLFNVVILQIVSLALSDISYKEECQSQLLATTKYDANCPVWTYTAANDTCKCGSDLGGIIQCDPLNNRVSIQTCSCMTYDDHEGVVVGYCFYGCSYLNREYKSSNYHPVPMNKTDLNEVMCGRLNRTGRLCGQCKEGYSPLVYSYDMRCINCTNSKHNWLKFTTIAFLPLTVFYFLVILFKVNVTAPQLYGFVTFCQVITSPLSMRATLLTIIGEDNSVSTAIRTGGTLYGVWNLDFFRTLSPKICLNVSTLTTIALDFAIAIYPLLLVTCTYILIELHARGYRLVLWLWRPFHKCFVRFNRAWDIQSSIIKAFATFLLLSYVKLLNVAFDLIVPTKAYNINKYIVGKYLYYDASYEYFGRRHLPYAVLSVTVILTLIIPPGLLLFFYPMKWFQKCLNSCHLWSQGLHIFIESFHGYYNDGTEPGTRDCRWFAAAIFLYRSLIFTILGLTKGDVITYTLAAILFIFIGATIIIVQPYKSEYSRYNTVEAVLALVLGMLFISLTSLDLAEEKAQYFIAASNYIIMILGTVPLIYITLVVLYYGIYQNCKGDYCKFRISRREQELWNTEGEPIISAHAVTQS